MASLKFKSFGVATSSSEVSFRSRVTSSNNPDNVPDKDPDNVPEKDPDEVPDKAAEDVPIDSLHIEPFRELISANSDELIDVFNSLQSKLIACDNSLDHINLPQIVVVGSQSAGKSSVLEAIVGKDFLPRGKDVVTRRPILVQLIPSREDYATLGHIPDVKFTDYDELRRELEKEMPTSTTDSNKQVKSFSSIPIHLTFFDRKVLKLTLVDLPGLVRVAMDGHPPDTVTEIREMTLQYIMPSESIILAVSPANQDIATSDALEIAKIADPERVRTIGVITKIDRMEACTDATKVLENREIHLKRGYVEVINRSQQDIEQGKDFQYILEKERNFFNKEQPYKHLAKQLGIPYLRKMLQKTLRAHIKDGIPETRARIAEKHYQVENQLAELNVMLGGDGMTGEYYMLRLVTDFIEKMNVEFMGNSDTVNMTRISAGALINYKLRNEVVRFLKISPLPNPEQLMISIINLHGIRSSLTIPSLALDCLNRKMLSEYEYPLRRSVDCITTVLETAVTESSSLMDGYPSMKNEVLYRIREQIKEAAVNTCSRLKDHVQSEMFNVNLSHPDLDLSACESLPPSACPTNIWDYESNGSTKVDEVEFISSSDYLMALLKDNKPMEGKVKYIIQVITKYMEIVEKQIIDVAIKNIISFLVQRVLDYMKKDLIPTLFGSPNIKSFTEDCEHDFRLKENLEKTAACLKEALEAIEKF